MFTRTTLTLGVYLKMLKLFEIFVKETDIRIAGVLALQNNEISNDEFRSYVDLVKMTNNLQEEVEELEQWHNHILEEINWLAITQNNYFDKDKHNELLEELNNKITKKMKQ